MSKSDRAIVDYEEEVETPEGEDVPRIYTRQEILLRRVLFYLGIVFWVIILSIPFFFVMLSIVGEFSFNLPGDVPDNRIRIWIIMEPDERGIGVSFPQIIEKTETIARLQTNVNYLLWEGEAEAVRYCEVFNWDANGESWLLSELNEGVC